MGQVLVAAGAYVAQQVWDWGRGLGQRTVLGLAIAVMLAGFLVVVGLDSGRNLAAAADMPMADMPVADAVTLGEDRQNVPLSPDRVARRLHHGTTTARMTCHRLTQAHFFTE